MIKRFSHVCLATLVIFTFPYQYTQALETQIVSPNAYKVPYLGYDGVFYLNTESNSSMKDLRNPKQIVIKKMEEFSFYKDTKGKTPIARNCHYAYLGAVGDSKFYPEYKTAVWDLFGLKKDESKDFACNQFKYLTFQAPEGEPIHSHFRYGDQKSSFKTMINMSNNAEDKAKFNPWWTTYCGGGRTSCGKD